MGKASSNKKVLRAASTGGGRTSRGSTPWGWYSVVAVAVVLGTVGIVFSRQQTQDRPWLVALQEHGIQPIVILKESHRRVSVPEA